MFRFKLPSGVALLLALVLPSCAAFRPVPRHLHQQSTADTRQFMFFAEEAPEGSLSIDIVASGDDEESINQAAKFLINSFWLDARHLVTTGDDDDSAVVVSDNARQSLYERQASDLFDNYGERMGKTILDSAVIKAVDSKNPDEIVGLVCVSSLLFDGKTETLLSLQESEELLKAAVATLGPKDRRRYKDASAEDIATGLLGNDMEAVCCISNLAVSPRARRTGVAARLCDEAERVASVEWGYEVMFLKVEADNTAARNLYEQKLQYSVKCNEIAATALRVDLENGQFVETEADTLILMKDI
ncbi:expressed unknown protein [Seminavis robusta]|uniref:N-acetyltransferase domain-containing protein n=1 Tax=Seminavis robusta TaxID=568900 RepID=A0A9N8DXU0_9STRA|nr:expressed unknown protein [Seminavis robusta]|eukprot:Sro361_g126670.1 n/a (302) ;mRNA; f:67166-68071